MSRADRLVWMDLEMTGLDPDADHIIEIATIITDSNLECVATGPNIIIHVCDEILESMNDWCVEHHQNSGLTRRVRESKTSLKDAEKQTLEFLTRYVDPQTSPLCGNSIWQDRRFLAKHMPVLEQYLHYRVIDVSSIKELVSRWYPNDASKQPPKGYSNHRALDDIEGSIRELRFYRDNIFVQ